MTQIHECGCYDCLSAKIDPVTGWPQSMMRMSLCPICGNKRCPRATNHRHACTNSNEPGQLGSRYGTPMEPNGPCKGRVEIALREPLYACNSVECAWTGPMSATVHPKHDATMILCPDCYETVEHV